MRRGQATVELALGVLVLVPMVLLGIYLAEYAQMSLKVQQSAMAAVWQASGQRVQNFSTGSTSRFDSTIPGDRYDGVAGDATHEFKDFDPTVDGNADVLASRSRGRGLRVDCEQRLFGPRTQDWAPAPQNIEQHYKQAGGFSCSAEADVFPEWIPTRFMMRGEGGHASQEVLQRDSIHVCAVGFPTGTSCPGRVLLLSNDWGLSQDETSQCNWSSCPNNTYRNMTRSLYGASTSASFNFARTYAGDPGFDPFQFSYVSVENDMTQHIASEGHGAFVTGGVGAGPWLMRTGNECFPGTRCP